MATTKAKTKPRTTKAKKPASPATKSQKSTATTTKTVVAKEAPVATKKQTLVQKIFGRKHDNTENILTIFKSPKIIGALIAELFGSMILVAVLLAVGAFNSIFDATMISFVVLGLSVAIFAISGAHINPIVTVGMMASRRIAPIRGVLYILAQILGAWIALLIINAYSMFNASLGVEMPSMVAVSLGDGETAGTFLPLLFLELIGAIAIGFAFARATAYKRSAFTFGAVAAGGVLVAFTLGLYVTAGFMGLQEHAYIFNPAAAIMFQILPSTGADLGDLFAKIGLALSVYVLAPALGAYIGFLISDTATAVADVKSE